MRGSDGMQETPFTMSKLEDFVPTDHPLRAIQVLVNEALGRLNGLFNQIYADTGRARLGKPLDVRTRCRPEGLQSAYDIVTQVNPFLLLNHIHARLT
jgi:hypothetical protein